MTCSEVDASKTGGEVDCSEVFNAKIEGEASGTLGTHSAQSTPEKRLVLCCIPCAGRSTQWLARARHAQAQQALAQMERAMGSTQTSEKPSPQTALVLNSLLWGTSTVYIETRVYK